MNASEVIDYMKIHKSISKQISNVKMGIALSNLGFMKRGKEKKYELSLTNLIKNYLKYEFVRTNL